MNYHNNFAHRYKNTWNGGEVGSYIFGPEWIFYKTFTVWEHKSLLLQLSGWLLMNRKVSLMDLRPSRNHILPKLGCGPVSNPWNFKTIDLNIWEGIVNVHTDIKQTNYKL